MCGRRVTVAAPLVRCPACDGYGEIWECVNDGKAGCSHINDYAYRCQDCNGEGEVASDEPLPHWTPRRDWPVALVLAVLIAGSLVFLALLGPAEHLMCATHRTAGHGALEYCADYSPTETAR